MDDSETVLAYLVPRLTNQVEDAATDVLAHILNRSPECRNALRRMLEQEVGFTLAPIVSVATQVTFEDGTRPDMAGYDRDGAMRLLVESKFWAALREGQPRYIGQFDHSDSAALLFIAPEARIETLWVEILRQFGAEEGLELEQRSSSQDLRSAKVLGGGCDAERGVILTSWRRLLDGLAAATHGNGVVAADVLQLRGLAVRQDKTAFLPVHTEDLGPEFGRRLASYCQLTDDLIGRGTGEKWMSIGGLQTTSQRWGYGRYFRFADPNGWNSDPLWLGINHEQWSSTGDTPLWLRCEWRQSNASAAAIAEQLGTRYSDRWIPIHLLKRVEYQAVLDDASETLKSIVRIVGGNPPAG